MAAVKADKQQGRPIGPRLWRWLLAGVLLGGLAVGGVWGGAWMMAPANLPLERIRVDGQVRHTKRERLQRTLAETVSGNFFRLDLPAVRAAVEALPWVSRASVRRVWPATLVVWVEEREALARWGTQGVVSAGGEVFVPDQATVPEGLALLAGPPGSAAKMVEQYQWMRARLAARDYQLSGLTLSDRQAWTLELRAGPRLLLGSSTPRLRLQRFLRHFPALSAGLQGVRAQRVDARYAHGLAVQWQPLPEQQAHNTGAEG